jgi:hypothetical protein
VANKGLSKAQRAARQAKSNALDKGYKHKASALKKAGVLTAKVDARKKITRATRTKINKYADVLEGRVTPVRAPAKAREVFAERFEPRGPFLMVPKERKREVVKLIKRGDLDAIEITRDLTGPDGLKFGEEREVIMPFKLTDMVSVAERLSEDESLDGLKNPDEFFAFRLDGWSSRRGFASAEDMGRYILTEYQGLFTGKMNKTSVKYLSFMRYRNDGGVRPEEGHHTYKLGNRRKPKPDKHDIERRKRSERNRKARQRDNESAAAYTMRIAKQRERQAALRKGRKEGK